MKALDSPKKIEPPPKPQEAKPPIPEADTIGGQPKKKAVHLKTIRELKDELGPLTEETKVEIEEAASQIMTIVKSQRDTFLKLLLAQVY
jgi:hypothetical protein